MDCVPIRYQEHGERNRVAAKMAIVSCGVTKDGSPRPKTRERHRRLAVTAPDLTVHRITSLSGIRGHFVQKATTLDHGSSPKASRISERCNRHRARPVSN